MPRMFARKGAAPRPRESGVRSVARRYVRVAAAVGLLVAGASPGGAQSYATDARRIGMGGIGERSNLAWDLVPSATPYRSIPVPLGLFQVLGNLDTFNPGSDAFNPAVAMSYASSPLHASFHRGGSGEAQAFMLDIVNANLSADLNAYRGFIPKSSISARGLAAPDFGKTVWLFDNGDTFHGVYLGAGPYLAFGTDLDFDEDLIDVLASSTDVDLADSSFTIGNRTDAQAALSFTGGYRLKLPLPGGSSAGRDGVYLAANYAHLYGLHYEDFDLAVRLDTDSAGMLASTSLAFVDRLYASNGGGRSVDFGLAVVMDRWDFTAGVEGLGNHIEWRGLGAERHSVDDVGGNMDFVETPLPAPEGALRVELPVRYSGGFGFDAGPWAVGADFAHGLDDLDFRGGLEYRLGPLDVRGGGRFIRNMWHPTTGVGLNFTDGFGIDVAMFGSAANIEQSRETSVAVSLRFAQER